MHGDEPIPEREFGAVHNGVCPEALPMSTVGTLEAFLRCFPIMMRTSAFGAHDSFLQADFPELLLAGSLIGEALLEFVYLHCCVVFVVVSFRYKYNI